MHIKAPSTKGFSLALLCLVVCFVGSTSTKSIIFHATVAQDGTGDYTTINKAVAAAPSFSQTRYYIRIKPGVYNEHVEVPKSKTCITLIGDAVATTKITHNWSNATGFTTIASATLSVNGDRFIAQYLTIENSAGPAGRQAVALKNEAKYSVFYKCVFLGYQDTLYIRETKQFYKNCDIYGTTDFIFGAGKAVFQDCRLFARLSTSSIVFTAQSRDSKYADSGFSFQNCIVTATPELKAKKSTIKAYLGRPWRPFSRVIFLESFLDDIVAPNGWLAFPNQPVDYALYAEYKNRGPGASTSKRVHWKGYRVIQNANEAMQFTVAKFIDGDAWLPKTGIPYARGLMK